jgi:hypothetical protein
MVDRFCFLFGGEMNRNQKEMPTAAPIDWRNTVAYDEIMSLRVLDA